MTAIRLGAFRTSIWWVAALLLTALWLGCSDDGSSSSNEGGDAGDTVLTDTSAEEGDSTEGDDGEEGGDGADSEGEDVGPDTTPDSEEGGDDADAGGEDAAVDPTEIVPGEWVQVLPDAFEDENVLKGIWMSGFDEGHVIGASGIAANFAGDEFEVLAQSDDLPNLNGIWGFSSDDIWAVGITGTLLHYDGEDWSQPGGCVTDGNCDDGDNCTLNTCLPDGTCQNEAVAAGPGCCGTGSWSADFDSGGLEINGWAIDSIYGASDVTWQVFSNPGGNGVPRYTSGTAALYFGNATSCVGALCPNYDNAGQPVGATATSPEFTVPQGASVSLNFDAWIDKEAGAGFDVFSVNVVLGGAAIPLWTAPLTHANFQPYSIDMSAWAGQTIQLQFSFDSVDGFGNLQEGVYVDTVELVATCGVIPESTGNAFPTFFDVWGPAPDDVYAVGLNGAAAHYDGQTWSEVEFGDADAWPLLSIFGIGDTLLTTGEAGFALSELNGGGLNVENTGSVENLNAMWAALESEVFAVGNGGTILRREGGAWTVEPAGSTADLNGVWGAGAFAVIAAGANGTILRREEGTWLEEVAPTGENYTGVWAQGSANIWITGDGGSIVGWDGAAYTISYSTATPLQAIHGIAADNIWAVGDEGDVVRYDGTDWSLEPTAPADVNWIDVWAADSSNVFVAGDDGSIWRTNGAEWTEMTQPYSPVPVTDMWGSGPSDMYASGPNFVLYYDGNEDNTWEVYANIVTPVTWRGACGTGPDNVILVGAGATVARWDGQSWGAIPVQPDQSEAGDLIPIVDQLYGCWATAEDELWAVGENGMVLEFADGRLRNTNNQTPISLRSVFALDSDLIIASGIEGVILYSRGIGSPWLPFFSGSVAGLFDIHGTTLDDITIVGDLGTILRFVPDPAAFVVEEETEEQ